MKMKKFLCLLTVVMMLFMLCACGAEEVVSAVQTGAEIVSAMSSDDSAEETEAPSEPDETMPPEMEQETEESAAPEEPAAAEESSAIDENGTYTSKEDVALYLHTYGHLPDNFITKKDAEALGWSGGSLEPYAPGMCIGGSRFGNYEGLLPSADGREYHECDIDTLGASSRGAKRIVYSNDGLIYYTEDHYETFELLYGEE